MQQYSLNLYLKYGKWVIFMGNYFLFIDILFSHVLISQTLWFIEMHVHRAAFSIWLKLVEQEATEFGCV